MKLRIYLLIILSLLFSNKAFASDGVEIELLKARISLESSDFTAAEKLMDRLYEENPGSVRIISTYAEMKNSMGKLRGSLELIDEALVLEPKNQYLAKMRKNILRNNQSFISLNQRLESRDGGVRQKISETHVEKSIAPFTNIGMEFSFNNARANLLLNESGVNSRLDEKKSMGSIYFRHRLQNEDKIKLSSYQANKINGAGVKYDFSYENGYNSVVLDYKKPSWEYLEGVANFGSFNQLLLKNSFSFNSRILFNSTIGHKSYNLGQWDNVSSSNILKFLASYRLPNSNELVNFLGDDGYAFLNYYIDGEYKSSRDEKMGVSGNNFTPINLQTREVHTIMAVVGKHITNNVSGELGAGIAKDRYKKAAPVFESNITYEHSSAIKFILYGYSRQNTVNSRESSRAIGLKIKKYF